jgi:hypothetical protein
MSRVFRGKPKDRRKTTRAHLLKPNEANACDCLTPEQFRSEWCRKQRSNDSSIDAEIDQQATGDEAVDDRENHSRSL